MSKNIKSAYMYENINGTNELILPRTSAKAVFMDNGSSVESYLANFNITVDSSLSSTSINPVQNKIIKSNLDTLTNNKLDKTIYNTGKIGIHVDTISSSSDDTIYIDNLCPKSTNEYDLGSSDCRWSVGYFQNINTPSFKSESDKITIGETWDESKVEQQTYTKDLDIAVANFKVHSDDDIYINNSNIYIDDKKVLDESNIISEYIGNKNSNKIVTEGRVVEYTEFLNSSTVYITLSNTNWTTVPINGKQMYYQEISCEGMNGSVEDYMKGIVGLDTRNTSIFSSINDIASYNLFMINRGSGNVNKLYIYSEKKPTINIPIAINFLADTMDNSSIINTFPSVYNDYTNYYTKAQIDDLINNLTPSGGTSDSIQTLKVTNIEPLISNDKIILGDNTDEGGSSIYVGTNVIKIGNADGSIYIGSTHSSDESDYIYIDSEYTLTLGSQTITVGGDDDNHNTDTILLTVGSRTYDDTLYNGHTLKMTAASYNNRTKVATPSKVSLDGALHLHAIELLGSGSSNGGYIDFHYPESSNTDHSTRIIEWKENELTICSGTNNIEPDINLIVEGQVLAGGRSTKPNVSGSECTAAILNKHAITISATNTPTIFRFNADYILDTIENNDTSSKYSMNSQLIHKAFDKDLIGTEGNKTLGYLGGVIHFTPGIFSISNIPINKSNIIFQGSGVGSTFIENSPKNQGSLLYFSNSASFITFRDICFRNKYNDDTEVPPSAAGRIATFNAIGSNDVSYREITFENCRFEISKNQTAAVLFKSISAFKINTMRFINCTFVVQNDTTTFYGSNTDGNSDSFSNSLIIIGCVSNKNLTLLSESGVTKVGNINII